MPSTESVIGAAGNTVERLSPITGGPSAPLKTRALFASFGPSLMPRAAIHQGMAVGLSVLAAELIGQGVDAAIRRFVPSSAPFPVRVGARAAVIAVGLAVSRIPETDDESTAKASVRSAGRLAGCATAPRSTQTNRPSRSHRAMPRLNCSELIGRTAVERTQQR